MEKKHDLRLVVTPNVYSVYEIPTVDPRRVHECLNCGDLVAHEFLVTHYDLIGPCLK